MLSDQTAVRGLQQGERHGIAHQLVQAGGYDLVLQQRIPQISPNSQVLGETARHTSQQLPPSVQAHSSRLRLHNSN